MQVSPCDSIFDTIAPEGRTGITVVAHSERPSDALREAGFSGSAVGTAKRTDSNQLGCAVVFAECPMGGNRVV